MKLKEQLKNKNLSILTLGIILALAAVLRLWGLGAVPVSPDWDEVALGYNAYSILQTGRDEYGKPFPVVLQSFNDYKPAFYVYTVIPFVALLGLEVLAVRLPSALFGIAAILGAYLLVKQLFTIKGSKHYGQPLALLVAFLLAISPWHIQFSRVAFEANMGLTINIWSVYFFLRGLQRPWFLSLAAAFMALNFYVYQSDRVFTPLLGIVLLLIYRKEVFKLSKKYLLAAIITVFVVLVPLLYYVSTNTNVFSRAKTVSILAKQTVVLAENQPKLIDDKADGNLLGIVLHNRRIIYAREIVGGYLSHFDLQWLFVRGDSARHHAPFVGMLYLWELPFIFLGIYALLFFPYPTKTKWLIISWMLITPIPAAITFDVPHAVRTLNFLPTFQIFVALGLLNTFLFLNKLSLSRTKKYLVKGIIYTFFLLFFLFNVLYYLNQYFVQQKYYSSEEWQYGYKEAVDYVSHIENKYDKIIISRDTPLDQSYMFFLFYLKYPPELYQKQYKNFTAASGAFDDNHNFGKFQFSQLRNEKGQNKAGVLYVGRPADFKHTKGHLLKTIDYLNGTPAIMIVEGK